MTGQYAWVEKKKTALGKTRGMGVITNGSDTQNMNER